MRKPKTKKKRKPYKKRTELQKVKDRVWELCKQIVRLRDRNICQKCGQYIEHGDASHVIPKGANSLRYDLKNLKYLCRKDHLYWWHKNILEAHEWFKEKFPNRYIYLLGKKNVYKKWTVDELLEYEKTLKEVLRQYENGL